jgi:mediator of RNA polymerase II transcription subunit 31
MCRVVQDLEDIFFAVHQCAGPDHPVAVSGLIFNLCVSLGYEDEDELEEALGGSLVDFLAALPHFEVVWPEQSNGTEQAPPEPKAKMRPDLGHEGTSREPRRIALTVSERDDLWRVVLQGPRATVEIPEIEFAIRPESKRRIDTIYNLIAAAVYNLGDHVRLNSRVPGSISDEDATKICDAIDSLNRLLDLEQGFTFVLSDPEGISDLKPMEGAYISTLVEEEERNQTDGVMPKDSVDHV